MVLKKWCNWQLAASAGLLALGGAITLLAQTAPPQAAAPAVPGMPIPVNFDDWFVDKALRIEIYQIGDAKEEYVVLDKIYEEPLWPENPRHLICPFDACHYDMRAYDLATEKLIFSHPFDSLFAEYRTTEPAIKGQKGVYARSLRMPMPKQPVKFVIENRDKKLQLKELFSVEIDPTDFHIVRQTVNQGDITFEHQKTGNPHDKVDLAFLSEGYAAEDQEKFKNDVKKMTDALFSYEPFKNNKDRFNIYGVFRASAERGMDEPRQNRYKSTALNATYNTFDTDRYLTIPDSSAVHRMAAQVPFDSVVVLVNTSRYGGGGISMDMCVSSVDHNTSPRIFVHEFGHSFAALADEYTGDAAYAEMHPEGIEPLECNITRLLDRDNIKWKQFLTPGVQIPTPPAARGGRGDREAETGPAGAPAQQVVGAFEGAGYMTRGMYRPQQNCIMGTALPPPNDEFCVVCKWGIQRMINYYSPEKPK
jgi:hypothetical protein